MGARYRYWGCKLLDCRWVNTEPNLQETQNEDIKVCGKCNRELNRYYRDPMEGASTLFPCLILSLITVVRTESFRIPERILRHNS